MALTLTFGSLLEVHVGDYCVGDGVTDDAAGLAQAVTAAGTTQRLVFQPGKTYLAGTKITLPSAVIVEGNGATLKRTTALNDVALSVTGAGVSIRDLNVDGNRAAGSATTASCVTWSGAAGLARRLKTANGPFGIYVAGAGAVLDAFDCEGNDQTTYGISVDSSGVLRCWGACRADNNAGSGFVFGVTAGAGCRLAGTANNNGSGIVSGSGARILAPAGTGGRFVSSNNRGYGIYAFGSAVCKDWTFEHVEDSDSGAGLDAAGTPNTLYPINSAATGVELFGVSGFKMPSVVVRRAVGYGVALTRDTGTNIGCINCSVKADVDGCGDPAFHISGGSIHNVVEGTAMNSTVAVSFGEGVPGQSDDNTVNVVATGCTYAVLNLNQGSRNRIDIEAIDCVTSGAYTSLARIGVIGGAGSEGICEDNIITWKSANPTTTDPAYIFKFDVSTDPAHNSTQRNKIISGYARDYATGLYLDPNGTNRVYLNRDYENVATYSASITLDASQARYHKIPVTNGTALTINAPTNNANLGARLRVDVFNSSGGAMGAITWNAAFTLTGGAFTNPANGKHRWIDFYWDGTKWVEEARAGADI